jgi:dienelactone hydrolase
MNSMPVVISEKETKSSIEEKKALTRKYLSGLLGDKPYSVRPSDTGPTTTARMDGSDLITGRPQVKNASVTAIGPYTGMGDHLQGYLYRPEQREQNKKFPVVLFLHQYAFNHGFAYGYASYLNTGNNNQLFQYLIDNGFAVMAIDMLGFGSRIEEGSRFYDRFPCWSKMGQMIADVDACVDAVAQFDYLDSDKVFLLGNTIGGTTALLAMALNEKIAGAAVLSGFSSWRESSAQDIKEMSQLYGFIPNLGFWSDKPEQVPVDFPEIMMCIAPRPLMVIAPRLDRHTRFPQVENSMKPVKNVYTLLGYPQNLQVETPMEISRLTNDMRESMVKFFKNHM